VLKTQNVFVIRSSFNASPARTIRALSFRQNRFLHVQPVLSLIENRAGICFENLGVDLLAAMRRRAMRHQRLPLRQVHQHSLIQYGPNSASRRADSSSVPIENPNVGVEHIGPAPSFLRIGVTNSSIARRSGRSTLAVHDETV
jgi:hypothetical protein